MEGAELRTPLPYEHRVYQLIQAGVPIETLGVLTEEGELPGSLGDWLIEIDAVYAEHNAEQQARLFGAGETA